MREGGGPDTGVARVLAQAEISQPHAAVLSQEDVLGLQVAMDDVLAVQVLDRLQELCEDSANPLLGEAAEIHLDFLLQVTLGAILHDNDEVRFGFKGTILHMHEVFLVRDDVPMSQSHKLFGLLAVLVNLGDVAYENLLRDEPRIITKALDKVDSTVAAGTDQMELTVLVPTDAADTAPLRADLPEVQGAQDTQPEQHQESNNVVVRHDQHNLAGFTALGLLVEVQVRLKDRPRHQHHAGARNLAELLLEAGRPQDRSALAWAAR
mmetsp:Transcript_65687/g.166473  ORF Transcript_65687/g.166473 Transcript_65687/m.166473 type:complete len:265 (-) Transcript_65687:303-1097(-)